MNDPYNWPVALGNTLRPVDKQLLLDKLSIVESEEPIIIIDRYASGDIVLAVRTEADHINVERIYPSVQQLIGEWIENEAHGLKPWVRHFNKETHDA